jgi:methylthioribose-1-phosphate isomerase
MKVDNKYYRTIWVKEDDTSTIQIIDQRNLPHEFVVEDLTNVDEAANAIKDMHVRGAPLIGATAAFGMYLASLESTDQTFLKNAGDKLKQTRPTAVDLAWAVDLQLKEIKNLTDAIQTKLALLENAKTIANESAERCKLIGEHSVKLIEEISKSKKGKVVNILTHCNAGWLGCVDYGTALAPIYTAHDKGIKVHVYVDETRPRNQGVRLTAWELGEHGVAHTVIADNTGGHLMQHGMVDIVIVGADRVTRQGDVANKIGTYLKALAAKDNNVPFYVALPESSFDFNMKDGVKEIPIEERGGEEVKFIQGKIIGGKADGDLGKVLLTPKSSKAVNYGFDVTPARLITGLITDKGICKADEEEITNLFFREKLF